jgi:hypothetical protein
MLCIVTDGKRIYKKVSSLVVEINPAKAGSTKLQITKALNLIKNSKLDVVIAIFSGNSVEFKQLARVDIVPEINITLYFYRPSIVLKRSKQYVFKNMIFKENEPYKLYVTDQESVVKFYKYIKSVEKEKVYIPKNSSENIKGAIYGHGRMRRENLEASYTRTEDYVEKLRKEGEERKKSL